MSLDEMIAVLLHMRDVLEVPGDTKINVDEIVITPMVVEVDYSVKYGIMIHTEAS